jgi:hypothetical protein
MAKLVVVLSCIYGGRGRSGVVGKVFTLMTRCIYALTAHYVQPYALVIIPHVKLKEP